MGAGMAKRCRVRVGAVLVGLLVAGILASASDGHAGGRGRRAPRGSLGAARLRAVRPAAGRQGRDAAEQRRSRRPRVVVGWAVGRLDGRDGHRLPVRRISAGRIGAGDLGELLRLAAPRIRAPEPHRLRRPAVRGAVVLRARGGRLLQPRQEDPGHPGRPRPGRRLRHRRARVRTPHRREPAERSLGSERLRPEAVGDLRERLRARCGRDGLPRRRRRSLPAQHGRGVRRGVPRARGVSGRLPLGAPPAGRRRELHSGRRRPGGGARRRAAALDGSLVDDPGRSLHRPGGRPQRDRRPDADAEDGRGLAGQDPRAGAVRAGRPRPLQAGQFPSQRAGSRPQDGRARAEAGSAGRLPSRPGVYRYRSDVHPALRGSFRVSSAGAARALAPVERTIATGLDGTVQATVSGTANATLELLDPSSGQVLAPPAPGTVSATACGQRSMLLRVAAKQAGTFRVVVSTP